VSDSVKFVMMVRDDGNGVGRRISNYYSTTPFRTKKMKERTKKHPRIPLAQPTTINSTPVNEAIQGISAPQEAKPEESVKVDVVEDSTPTTEASANVWKLKCPKCDSHKTRHRSKTNDNRCERCGNIWVDEPKVEEKPNEIIMEG
jgi:ribosomal protein S27E